MGLPPAEWPVTEELVDALVREQAPAYAGPVRWIASGWDNEVFRVGDQAVARLPRRAAAVPLVRNEQRCSPSLPELPLPISRPVVCGKPTAQFPHPWTLFEFASRWPT